MKRLFPAPLLSLALLFLWVFLDASTSAGSWLMAVIVGVVTPLLSSSLRPDVAKLANPKVALRLVVVVVADVVSSSLQVASGVLRLQSKPPRSAFVAIPLDLQDVHGLAALAVITTVVPGTVWSELTPDRRFVVLHVFDVGDEAAFIDHYKKRYERPLKEIFE
jgi:multicomponent K+:H+ antiporter subunit E